MEILQGVREIKRREFGRVINVPDVAETRQKTGLSQVRFAQLFGRCKTGNPRGRCKRRDDEYTFYSLGVFGLFTP